MMTAKWFYLLLYLKAVKPLLLSNLQTIFLLQLDKKNLLHYTFFTEQLEQMYPIAKTL